MSRQFAIITFRDTGPIKNWSDMRAASVHNARTRPLAHAVANAPAPEHLIGTGDLVADVKRHLRCAKIDPGRLRKNGVIAYEAVLSASAEFFDAGSSEERAARLAEWKAAQMAWAISRYGAQRIPSMVLHVDEKVPHIHLIVIPLETKLDGRRKDQRARWSLVGRTISGPGRFDEVQDDYAKAMEPFGLMRGLRGSGRKHEPVPVYLARMAAKERAIDLETAALARDRAAVALRLEQVAAREKEVARRLQEIAARAERIALAEREVAADRELLGSQQATFARFRSELIASREKLVPIVAEARQFVRAAEGIRPSDIVPAARPAVAAAQRVIDACIAANDSASVFAHDRMMASEPPSPSAAFRS